MKKYLITGLGPWTPLRPPAPPPTSAKSPSLTFFFFWSLPLHQFFFWNSMIFFSCQKRPIFGENQIFALKLMCKWIYQAKKTKKNEADICRSIGFNHTNDKIHIPRTPREEERKILDEIFKDSKHFSKLKSCAKLILIFSKIIEKSSQGPNFYDFFCVRGYLSHNLYAFNEYKWQIHKIPA